MIADAGVQVPVTNWLLLGRLPLVATPSVASLPSVLSIGVVVPDEDGCCGALPLHLLSILLHALAAFTTFQLFAAQTLGFLLQALRLPLQALVLLAQPMILLVCLIEFPFRDVFDGLSRLVCGGPANWFHPTLQ